MEISWEQLGTRLMNNSNRKGLPIVGQFELTSRCNLSCRMCYIHNSFTDEDAKRTELSAKEWISLAEQARDAGTLYLMLTGGEVFLRKDFKTIYEEISMMGFNIELLTNASMITPEIAKWLGRIPPSKVGITLYGASAETYGKVCGNAQAYKETINGIELLLNEGISLDLKTTVIRSNIEDFNWIADFSFEKGLQFGVVNYISPRRDGCNNLVQEERLSPKELSIFETHAETYLNERIKSTWESDNDGSAFFSQDTDNTIGCTAGRSAYWITSEGKMTPCGLMEEPYALPVKSGLSTAWNNLKEKYASLPYLVKCSNCELREYCMACPARLKNETGFYDKCSKYLCELAQYRRETPIK